VDGAAHFTLTIYSLERLHGLLVETLTQINNFVG
jgi:hypothetical protein